MDRLYEYKVEEKAKVKDILEADPYSKESIARIGYIMRDGNTVDGDKDMVYIYVTAPEDKIKMIDEKLKDNVKIVKEETAKKIIDKIKGEQDSAATGFGNIFG